MADYIYTMNQVGKVVDGNRFVLKDISLSFIYGAKIGVLGLNGSGKSTLLKIMAGVDEQILGEASARKGTSIGYLSQEPELDSKLDVRGNVELAVAETKGLLDRFNEISASFAEPLSDDEMTALLEEQGTLQGKIDACDGWELDRRLDIAGDALRLPPWESSVEHLSGGEKRRVALCQLLLSQPDILLLDEPTNHLDAQSVAWLEHHLERYPGTVVAVTHDRYFLDNVAQWILELDRGQGIPFKGNYSSWLEQKSSRLENQEKSEKARAKALKDELDWVRQQARGQQTKSKARLSRFDELCQQDYQERNETRSLYIPPGPRLGNQVITLNGVGKQMGDTQLFDTLNMDVPAGAVVGIIGANGAGKSTLFKIITGQESADSGSVALGETVELAYVDQSRDMLSDTKTVWEDISDGLDVIQVGKYETPSRAYVGRFNFKGTDQQKRIKVLSGGERNRVHLAKTLKKGGNVLLLDEPSNDLDVETLRALEEAILEFPGTVLVISHDRWFLDRICTHILAFEDSSDVVYFTGNYSEYETDYRKRLGVEELMPKRIKHQRLVR